MMAQSMVQMAALIELANHALPDRASAPLVGDDQVGPPAELATHAPSTVSPRFEDHVHEVGSCICDTWPSSRSAVAVVDPDPDGMGFDVQPPASEVRPVASVELGADQSSPPAIEHVPPPPSGVRAKNEYTAAEWANGPHFLNYIKAAPYNAWPTALLDTRRDAFVAQFKNAPRQSRWGRTFSKFIELNYP